mgnify:CR=1 FL=1
MWSSTASLSTGAAPPDSPVALQVVTAGRTSATMAWRTPDDDGGSKVVAFGVSRNGHTRIWVSCHLGRGHGVIGQLDGWDGVLRLL